MLEVIESDFARSIDTVTADEEAAEEAFTTYKADTETDITEKEELVASKTRDQKEQEGILADSKDDLQMHTGLKDAAIVELARLKPACVSTGSDYAEQVARREQEIESLKNAYLILDEMR